MSEKQIKIQLVVDEVSVRRARQAIADLISDAGRLGEAFKQAQLHIGGHGGVSPFSAHATAQGPQDRAFQGAEQHTMKAGVGMTDMLGRSVQAVSQMFRGAAEGSKTAFRAMNDALRDAASSSEPHLKRLEGAIRGIGDAFRQAKQESQQAGQTFGQTGPSPVGPSGQIPRRGALPPGIHRAQEQALHDAMSGVATQGAALYRQAPGQSYSMLSDAIAQALSRNESQTGRVEGEARRLERAYERVRDRRAGGDERPGDEGKQVRQQAEYMDRLDRLGGLRQRRRELLGERDKLRFEAGQMGEGGPGADDAYASMEVSQGGGAPPWWKRPIGGQFLHRMGVPGWAMKAGVVGAGLYGAYKALDIGSNAYASVERANIEETLNKENYAIARRAQAGQTFGGLAMSIKHGDIGRMMASASVMGDASFKRLMGFENVLRREQIAGADAGKGIMDSTLTGEKNMGTAEPSLQKLKQQAVDKTKGWFHGVVDSIGEAISNADFSGATASARLAGPVTGASGGGPQQRNPVSTSETSDSVGDIKLRRGRAQIPITMMQEMQHRIEQELAADPIKAATLNEVYGQSFGRLSLARAAGIGGGPIVDKATGKVIGDSTSRFIAGAQRMGYNEGERASAWATLGHVAGRGFMGRGDTTLNMQSGGLAHAAQLFGIGAQYGGYAGGRGTLPGLLQGVQSSIGTGGLDVTAGGKLGELMAHQMGAGSWLGGIADRTGSGAAAVQGLAAMAFTPERPGENLTGMDMRMARVMQQGVGGFGAMISGQVDPLQQALSYKAAVDAAGHLGHYAHNALTRLDPTQLLDILASGEVPEELRAMGITLKDVQGFNAGLTRTQTVRAITKGMSGPQAAMFQRFRDSEMNVGKYLNKSGVNVGRMFELQKKGKRTKAEQEELRGLTDATRKSLLPIAATQAQDMGWTNDQALGTLLAQLIPEAPKLAGKGAHNPISGKSQDMQGARMASDNTELDEEDRAALYEITKGVADTELVKTQRRKAEGARKAAGAGGETPDDLSKATAGLTTAFGRLAVATDELLKIMAKGGVKVPSRATPGGN